MSQAGFSEGEGLMKWAEPEVAQCPPFHSSAESTGGTMLHKGVLNTQIPSYSLFQKLCKA